MSRTPKVTVFIPVYNREHYVTEAIDSILGQTFTDFELLLLDDGSTDGTVAAIEAYDDPRIRLERSEENLGIPRIRNRGLALARGEYMAMLDSDDIACPERLARQVAFLDARPEYAAIGAWSRWIDGQGRAIGKVKKQPIGADEVKAHLMFRCCLNNRSMTGRTEALRKFGYRNSFQYCEDYDLLCNLSVEHKLGNLPEVLVLGRAHDQRITAQTPGLLRAKQREIAARQLTALGVTFDEDDSARHAVLSRLGKLDHAPDQDFLDWTEGWLHRLSDANRRAEIYTAPAFRRVLGFYWLKACSRSSRGFYRDTQRLLASPLRLNAMDSLIRDLLVK